MQSVLERSPESETLTRTQLMDAIQTRIEKMAAALEHMA